MPYTSQGTRQYPDPDGQLRLKPGGYGVDGAGLWLCRPPGCHTGCLSEHVVAEHEDGTITVSPSIRLTQFPESSWHGYLERGVWKGC